MRRAFFLAILLAAATFAQAGSVLVTSPDHAQTFAYGEMIWHQLWADPVTHQLHARVTFSNLPNVGGNDQRVDEPFDFHFPKTEVDFRTHTIFIRGRRGLPITVARFRGDPTNGWVDLTSGAKIYLLKESGCVTAVLTATSEPRQGMRWIQMDNNWSLQNLLAGLCSNTRSRVSW